MNKTKNRIITNIIYNDDCIHGMDCLPEESIDMILCDPPYGTTSYSWDIIVPFEKLWREYERIIKKTEPLSL